MEPTVTVAIIAAFQAIGVAVIGGLFTHYTRKAEARAKALTNEEESRKESRQNMQACMYDLVFANTNALEVLLHQAHGDKINGNVDEALDSIKKAKTKCNSLLNETASKV